MKNKITKLFVVLMLSGFVANAQTDEKMKANVVGYDQEWLKNFEKEQRNRWDRNYELALKIARDKDLPVLGLDEDGNYFELVGLIEDTGELKYYKTSRIRVKENVLFNNTSTKSSIQTARVQHLHDGTSTGGVIVEGQTMIVGEWDGGSVYAAHSSLGTNRVTQKDNSTGDVTADGTGIAHASHVAGTMVANNSDSTIKGMAPQASLWANNWIQDISEMTSQAGQGLLTSNHSYGVGYYQSGFHNNPAPLGRYNSDSRILDQLLYNAEYYLPVYAAGNDRNGEWTGSQYVYFNTSKGGLDLLYGEGASKNNVVVAAVEGVTDYQQSSNVVMSSFSNWGPTDDFRIKPDISAKGVNVKSVGVVNTASTAVMDGTSMAAPSVTGVFTLWQQYFKQLYPTKGMMRAATVKALMAISADEAGTADGPDPMFGWGLINAARGAEILRDSKPAISKSVVSELELTNGQEYQITVNVDGTQPLKAAIAWTDPAGVVKSQGDDSTPDLVNDLDLRIIRPNNQEALPWALNDKWNNIYAAKKDNTVDPIEVVEYKGAATGVASPGTYTIKVSHKGTLTNGSQKFSLIIYGFEEKDASTKKTIFDNLVVYPNPVSGVLNISADLISIANANVKIYDITGKQVYENGNLFYNTNMAAIDISSLNSGVYMLKIETDNTDQTIKVIKK